MAHEHN